MKDTASLRIVSLLPSSTEIICQLGFTENLVGISHECDYPLVIKDLPICTEAKFDARVSSIEIDLSVKQLVSQGLSVYRVHTDLLEHLQPDFIVTQSQCEVCAVSYNDVQVAVCQLVSSQPTIINLEPNFLQDIWQDIQKVADILNVSEKGQHLIADFKQRIEQIQNTIAKKSSDLKKPRVATIEWIKPLMNAGNWIPEMVEIAGGINLLGNSGEHSHYIQWEELVRLDPDIILLMPCGFDITRTMQEIDLITSLSGYYKLKAVQSGQVFVTDGNAYFNRPGTRIMDSIEILAEIFYPNLFLPKHSSAYLQLKPEFV
jgi:iron complex transport system substrate-binding protein